MSLSAGDPTIFFSSIVSLMFFSLIILTIALQIRKRMLDVKKQKKLKEQVQL
jgi:TctA family transporter